MYLDYKFDCKAISLTKLKRDKSRYHKIRRAIDKAKLLTGTCLLQAIIHRFSQYLFFYSVLRPFQDYFSSCESGQSVGGRKREHPEKNHLAHPQAELGLSHVWPLRGSNPFIQYREDPVCRLCKQQEEYIVHMLLYCPLLSEIYKNMIPIHKIERLCFKSDHRLYEVFPHV